MNSLIKYTCDYEVVDKRPFSQKVTDLLETTNGRDKIFRLIQYYVKFVLPYLKEKKEYAKISAFFEGIAGGSNTVRKMLRIGKHVNLYRNIISRFNKNSASIDTINVLKTFGDLFNSIYFILDHILLLNRINAIKIENSATLVRLDWQANLFWGGECLTSFLAVLIDYLKNSRLLRELLSSLKKIDSKESAEYKTLKEKIIKLKYEQFKRVLDMMRCLADMPLILHFLTSDKVVPNSVASLCGVVSSLIGIYQKW